MLAFSCLFIFYQRNRQRKNEEMFDLTLSVKFYSTLIPTKVYHSASFPKTPETLGTSNNGNQENIKCFFCAIPATKFVFVFIINCCYFCVCLISLRYTSLCKIVFKLIFNSSVVNSYVSGERILTYLLNDDKI